MNAEFQKQLLIIAHAPSANTQQLRDAAFRGASHSDLEQVHCVVKAPLEAGPEDVLACDAILLGTTENLGYMSGALKDFLIAATILSLKRNRDCPARSIFAQGTMARAPSAQWKALSLDYAGDGYSHRSFCAASGSPHLQIR